MSSLSVAAGPAAGASPIVLSSPAICRRSGPVKSANARRAIGSTRVNASSDRLRTQPSKAAQTPRFESSTIADPRSSPPAQSAASSGLFAGDSASPASRVSSASSRRPPSSSIRTARPTSSGGDAESASRAAASSHSPRRSSRSSSATASAAWSSDSIIRPAASSSSPWQAVTRPATPRRSSPVRTGSTSSAVVPRTSPYRHTRASGGSASNICRTPGPDAAAASIRESSGSTHAGSPARIAASRSPVSVRSGSADRGVTPAATDSVLPAAASATVQPWTFASITCTVSSGDHCNRHCSANVEARPPEDVSSPHVTPSNCSRCSS